MPYASSATCHPGRRRKTSDGLCDTCYLRRRYQTDPEYRSRKNARTTARSKERYAELAGPLPSYFCAYCGTQHTSKSRDSRNRFCSRQCQDAHNKMVRRVGRSESGGYTRQEIFERDGWVCQLCHERITRGARSPDPMSASVDHIVPLHLGGTDDRANVQASHLGCNIAKGIRAVGEQLRLV